MRRLFVLLCLVVCFVFLLGGYAFAEKADLCSVRDHTIINGLMEEGEEELKKSNGDVYKALHLFKKVREMWVARESCFKDKEWYDYGLELIDKDIAYVEKMMREWPEIILVARTGDLERVKKAVEGGVDVNAATKDGWTALMVISELDVFSPEYALIAEYLIQQGADVDARDADGRTALMLASYAKQEGIVMVLIANGADVNAKDKDDWTALMVTLIGEPSPESTRIAKALIDNGADVNARNFHQGTPLIIAAAYGNIEIAKVLIEKGADIEAKEYLGRTPLMWAAIKGNGDMVRFLISNGANIEARDKFGNTALIHAAASGRFAAVQTFLIYHADANAKDNKGLAALDWAEKKSYDAIAAMLRLYMEK